MFRRSLAAVLALAIVFSVAEPAMARNSRSGGSHSKSQSGFAERSCKTQSCYKKHPSGHYAAPTGKKRKK